MYLYRKVNMMLFSGTKLRYFGQKSLYSVAFLQQKETRRSGFGGLDNKVFPTPED